MATQKKPVKGNGMDARITPHIKTVPPKGNGMDARITPHIKTVPPKPAKKK
jgi:hypothetical protein